MTDKQKWLGQIRFAILDSEEFYKKRSYHRKKNNTYAALNEEIETYQGDPDLNLKERMLGKLCE